MKKPLLRERKSFLGINLEMVVVVLIKDVESTKRVRIRKVITQMVNLIHPYKKSHLKLANHMRKFSMERKSFGVENMVDGVIILLQIIKRKKNYKRKRNKMQIMLNVKKP